MSFAIGAMLESVEVEPSKEFGRVGPEDVAGLSTETLATLPDYYRERDTRIAIGQQVLQELAIHLNNGNPPVELPKAGIIAGGAVANLIINKLFGTKAPIRDVDHFIRREPSGPNPKPLDEQYYQIENIQETGLLSTITYSAIQRHSKKEAEVLLNTFDMNCVKVAVNCHTGELYPSKEFIEFLKTKRVEITRYARLPRTLGRFWDKVLSFNCDQTPEQRNHNRQQMLRAAIHFHLRWYRRQAHQEQPDYETSPRHYFELSEKSANKAQLLNTYASEFFQFEDTQEEVRINATPHTRCVLKAKAIYGLGIPKDANSIKNYTKKLDSLTDNLLKYVVDRRGVLRKVEDATSETALLDNNQSTTEIVRDAAWAFESFQQDSIKADFACVADLHHIIEHSERPLSEAYLKLLEERGTPRATIQAAALRKKGGFARLPQSYQHPISTVPLPPAQIQRVHGCGKQSRELLDLRTKNGARYHPQDGWTIFHTAVYHGTLKELPQELLTYENLSTPAFINSHGKEVRPIELALDNRRWADLPPEVLGSREMISDEQLAQALQHHHETNPIPKERWTPEFLELPVRDDRRYLGGVRTVRDVIPQEIQFVAPETLFHLYPHFKERVETYCSRAEERNSDTTGVEVVKKWMRRAAVLYVRDSLQRRSLGK